MGMVIRTVTFGEQEAREVCFNTHAIYKLEELTQKPVQGFVALLQLGRAGERDLVHVLWAGLEGGRLYRKQQRGPYTLDEVCQLLDEAGGVEVFFDAQGANWTPFIEAWKAHFPVTQREFERQKAEAAAKAASGGAPRPTSAPTGDTTGTASPSTSSASSGSRKRSSGGGRSVN